MGGRLRLLRVERLFCSGLGTRQFNTWQQQAIKKLQGYDVEWRRQPFGNLRGRHGVDEVQLLRHRPWQDEFPSKEVHLDFSTFPTAVVDNAVNTDGRRLGRPHRIGRRRYIGLLTAIELHMPQFVSDQKRMNELIAGVLMQNQESVWIKGRATTMESNVPDRDFLDHKVPSDRFSQDKCVGTPRIAAALYGLKMKPLRCLPADFDRIHLIQNLFEG